jgi:hypothetical protein
MNYCIPIFKYASSLISMGLGGGNWVSLYFAKPYNIGIRFQYCRVFKELLEVGGVYFVNYYLLFKFEVG